MYLPKSNVCRKYVPFILNGLVVRWYLEKGELQIKIEVPMRYYPGARSEGWIAKQVEVNFTRRLKTHVVTDESPESVVETFYACDNNSITFEEETIPVIR